MLKYLTKKISPTTNDSVGGVLLNNNHDEECKYEKEETRYVLYFDGCSKGNPGLGGAGAVLYEDSQEVWGSSQLVGEKVTNNVIVAS